MVDRGERISEAERNPSLPTTNPSSTSAIQSSTLAPRYPEASIHMDPLWILLSGIVVVLGGILVLRLHAFLALVLGALVVGALTPRSALERFARDKKMTPGEAEKFANRTIGERVAIEFGDTCGKIGILVALASLIGKCLLESGGADRIVRSTLKILGEPRAPWAFLTSGYLLGIPIFFDTVFLLMIPLGKAMWMRTKRNYVFYIVTIIAGATMTHSLVPPTPGPLYVASALNVDLGVMILAGCVVGAFTSVVGYAYGSWVNARLDLPVRESQQSSLAELEALSRRDARELPPLWISLLPIGLPVLLIGGAAVVDSMAAKGATLWDATFLALVKSLGNANVAVAIASAVALATLAWQKRTSLAQLSGSVQSALAEGGVIILITAGGGAFGGVLQQTGIGPRIQEWALANQIAVLPLAFAVTALVRTAQGSATVAMITAVGMFVGVATAERLGFHPVYLAMAIGCGSKLTPWMNDSGFWVVCKMSGMTERETLKIHSVAATLMGLAGIVVTMLLARIWPMT